MDAVHDTATCFVTKVDSGDIMTRHLLTWSVGFVSVVALASACGPSQLDGKPTAVVSEPDNPQETHVTAPSPSSPTKEEVKPPVGETIKALPAEQDARPERGVIAQGDSNDGKSRPLFLDTSMSKVGFVGSKVTKDHEGSFESFDGKAMLDGYSPVSFEITVDTASVVTQYDKLTAHLKNEDFFFVSKYPKARFVSRQVLRGGQGSATHTVIGELTLRAVTKKITFPISLVTTDAGATGLAEFKINRKDFGMVYAGMADDLINDQVLLKLNLAFLDEKYRQEKTKR